MSKLEKRVAEEYTDYLMASSKVEDKANLDKMIKELDRLVKKCSTDDDSWNGDCRDMAKDLEKKREGLSRKEAKAAKRYAKYLKAKEKAQKSK